MAPRNMSRLSRLRLEAEAVRLGGRGGALEDEKGGVGLGVRVDADSYVLPHGAPPRRRANSSAFGNVAHV